MRFSDIRIGSKLAIGFGSVLVLMIALVLFDFYFIKLQHERLTEIVNNDTAKLEIVTGLNNALQEKATTLSHSILLNDQAAIALTLSDIESNLNRHIQLSKQFESLQNAEEKLLFEKISVMHRSVKPLIDRLTPLVLANRDAEAHKLLLIEFMPLQKNLISSLDELSLTIRNRLKAENNTEEKTMKKAQAVGITLGLLAIVVSIIFALFTAKSILQPLMLLERETQKLKIGDYNLTLPVERKDEIGALATTIKRSVEELHKHIEIVKNYEFQLLNKEKLASIGELTAGIVHNLKNPLNAIIGFAETVQRKRPEVEYIDYILDAGRDMDKIIENILYKTRQEQSSQEKPIDINKMLTNGLTFLEANPLFKSNVQKNIELDDALPKISGVYSDFSQSFSNIIRNALDAIYNSETKTLTVKTWHDERYIYVMVGDTGEGIAEDKLEKIFEAHFTTKATADEADNRPIGNGLGLYMVRELMKKYNAEYDIKSQIGKGTEFTVLLPVANITKNERTE